MKDELQIGIFVEGISFFNQSFGSFLLERPGLILLRPFQQSKPLKCLISGGPCFGGA